MYRAFYSVPSMKYNGQEVGALFGFCSEIINLISTFGNSIFIAALDSAKHTFRNDIYPEYKANRTSMPNDLLSQCPLIREACEKFGFKTVSKKDYEADDIIATYAKYFYTKHSVTVVSCDKDLLQLLRFNEVKIYNPSKHRYINVEDVLAKYGVMPCQLLDTFSLIGDTTDNIPGIPSIGIKTASKLITQYKSVEGLISNLDKLPNTKQMQQLKANIDKATLSKRLVELNYSVDVDFDLNNKNKPDAINFLLTFGFHSLIKRLNRMKYLH